MGMRSNPSPKGLSSWIAEPVSMKCIVMQPNTKLKQARHPTSVNKWLCCVKKEIRKVFRELKQTSNLT